MPPPSSACAHERKSSPEDEDEGVVEVQIVSEENHQVTSFLPSKDETKAFSMSAREEQLSSRPNGKDRKSCLSRWLLGNLPKAALWVMALLTPILFAALPKVSWTTWPYQDHYDVIFMSIAAKEIILVLTILGMTSKRRVVYVNRKETFSIVMDMLVLLLVAAYWLLFYFRIIHRREPNWEKSISYSNSLLDLLILIHVLLFVLVLGRTDDRLYVIKVLRHPDGCSRFYAMEDCSVQECASRIVHRYFADFPDCAAVERSGSLPKSDVTKKNRESMSKDTDVSQGSCHASLVGHRSFRSSDDTDQEKRRLKAKARLIAVAEEAFNQVERGSIHAPSPSAMTANEAASVIFPMIAPSLRKYIRITGQQHRYPLEVTLNHLSDSIRLGLSATSAMEYFLVHQPCGFPPYQAAEAGSLKWTLACSGSLRSKIRHGQTLTLRQGKLYIILRVTRLPETILSSEPMVLSDRFGVKIVSETCL